MIENKRRAVLTCPYSKKMINQVMDCVLQLQTLITY